MRSLALVIALIAAVLTASPATSWAGQGRETFSGTCSFDATDEFAQPILPLQIVPGTLRGSGTCTGAMVDASGSRHPLHASAARLVARRAGPGGCAGASNVGTGTLSLPYGAIDFRVTETFVGSVGFDRLTGAAGGTGSIVLAVVDRYDDVFRHCLDGSPQKPRFLVHLTSDGLAG